MTRRGKVRFCMISLILEALFTVFFYFSLNDIQGIVASVKGLDHITCISEGISESDLAHFQKSLDLVEDNVIQSYLRHNNSLFLLNEEEYLDRWNFDYQNGIADLKGYGVNSYGGYFGLYETKTSWRKNDYVGTIVIRNGFIDDSVVHEFGHYIDYVVVKDASKGLIVDRGAISNSEEFLKIFYEERYSSYLGEYYTNDPKEFFAESYRQMKINENYKTYCPKTCEFIEKCISKV